MIATARQTEQVDNAESWTVLGDDDAPIAPVEAYLAYLTDIERSPNTVRAASSTWAAAG